MIPLIINTGKRQVRSTGSGGKRNALNGRARHREAAPLAVKGTTRKQREVIFFQRAQGKPQNYLRVKGNILLDIIG
jgi:hypothetical protein